MNTKKIKRAIISVSNKSNLKKIIPILKKYNVEILSSGGSYKEIIKMKCKCTKVSNYTGFPEILSGRVKTLHPRIHAGILNIRKNKKHQKDLILRNIKNIDLVIVDLYPFEENLKQKKNLNELIEYIDIGGPTLIRSAAKNFNDVAVISDNEDYEKFVNEFKKNKGFTSLKFRKEMSAKAFSLTAYYDSIISNWMNKLLNIKFPKNQTIHGKIKEKLLYGENPHQEGRLYNVNDDSSLKKIHGKKLSYNNYNDIYSALAILETFQKKQGTAIVKHANPSGVSNEKNQMISYKNAIQCDPISAYGGVVAINSSISKKLAYELNKKFFEVIIARGYQKSALKILKKKNVRLIDAAQFKFQNKKHYLFLGESFLSQDSDNDQIKNNSLKTVTKIKTSSKQLNNLKFAFNICKFVKSNGIVIVNNNSTIGIGSGQPSRLDSCKIAGEKALQFVPEKIINSVAASDAFFPFPDGIEELVRIGVKAIIQPGGSKNDKAVIKAANKAGISMVFTGRRHFRH